jgi:hypothetical protein
MRDIKIGDFVVYENPAKTNGSKNVVSITVEQVTKLYDETFDSKDKKDLKKFRIRKVKSDYKNGYDYHGFDPTRISEENYGTEY